MDIGGVSAPVILAMVGLNFVRTAQWKAMFCKIWLMLVLHKTDKSKRYLFSFGRKLLTDKKMPPLFLGPFSIQPIIFFVFCLFFLSVSTDWVGKCCGRKLGGQFG
jgi:hypothetical protein